MSIRNLDKIFKPNRVVLLGLEARPESLGRRVLANLLDGGFRGIVYPVSETVASVSGVATYPGLRSLPNLPDMAVICSPARDVVQAVRDCYESGILGAVILSGGFGESGPEGRQLEQALAATLNDCRGMRIIGPNSLGIIVPDLGLNASQAVAFPRVGHLAFISQSHSLSNAILEWSADAGIGFSLFASLGNNLDVGYGDIIDYLGTDAQTRAIILYIQSIEYARRFMSAARSFAFRKPIVAYKSGHYERSARAALSHTGTIAGQDAVYSAAFERSGIVRVSSLDDIFDVAEILASQRLPGGPRLAIVGNAGGPAIIAADALILRKGELANLDDITINRLDELLADGWSHANPVDLLDDAGPARYAGALEIVLSDINIDAVLVIYAHHPLSNDMEVAEAVAAVAKGSRKPVFAAWMGGGELRKSIRFLNKAGVPAHASPEQAIQAIMHLVTYASNLESLYQTTREIPIHFSGNRNKIRQHFHSLLQQKDTLSEGEAKMLLKAYDIPVCETCLVRDAEAAVRIAGEIGYPVVMKICSPALMHKFDIGGVALNLRDEAAVRTAFEHMQQLIVTHGLNPESTGMTLQRMVESGESLEMILGSTTDQTFGPVIMVGLGGVATGLYRDHSIALPPLNERLARRMLESLGCWPLLQGYRGRSPVAIDKLIEAMIRFSCLVADYPELREIDINPLRVSAKGVIALDAAAVIDRQVQLNARDPYRHMAIRPYPEQFMRRPLLRDGTEVLLRPIRPEDEALWQKLIGSSSTESIRFRFRSLFKSGDHNMAVKHCMIDYDRELALVVETGSGEQRELAGVAQLMTDLNHETAEYAVIVPDPWQGRGIGALLLDYCIEVARRWGIATLVAETDPDNKRMLDMFSKRGFSSQVFREEEVVLLRKNLVT